MESVDGLFWTRSTTGDLHVLLASGVRPDRPGLGVIPLPVAPSADAHRWLDSNLRDPGPDFELALPGADLDELYSFQTAGEPLKLLARFFALIEGGKGRVQDVDPTQDSGGGTGPRPSTLAFKRVTLD